MKYLKWISLIFRILPHLEKLYTQILVSIEVVKEEITNSEANGNVKRVNVRNNLRSKVDVLPGSLSRIIDNTVSTLNELELL